MFTGRPSGPIARRVKRRRAYPGEMRRSARRPACPALISALDRGRQPSIVDPLPDRLFDRARPQRYTDLVREPADIDDRFIVSEMLD